MTRTAYQAHRSPTITDYTFPENGLVGEGAYGEVWYALYKEDQPRAVKIFKPDGFRSDLWKQEYEKLKALDEPPGIVTLYDQGKTADGMPYVAMRLMADPANEGGWRGRTLMDRIDAGDLDEETKWRFIFEIADTLAYLDKKGVVHCDVKPTNVLLSAGDEPRPVLCDFGQSIGDNFSPETATGTLLYASPEQLRQDESVIRSWDVYSFGVVAWQLLTGRYPRLENFANELMHTDLSTALSRTLGASLDRELVPMIMMEAVEKERILTMPKEISHSPRKAEFEVVMRCLALKGDRPARFTSMSEVVEAFQDVQRRRVIAKERRGKMLFASLMVFGLIAALIAGWQWHQAESSRKDVSQSLKEQERLGRIAEEQRDNAENQRRIALGLKENAEEQRTIALELKETAEENERVALLARNTAEGLINSMLYDLKGKLAPLGRLDLLDDVSSQAENYFKTLPKGHRTEASERERSSMLNNRGEVYLATGIFAEARKAFEEARLIREKLVEDAPRDPSRLRDLSVSIERLGDVYLAQGNAGEAEKLYRQSLEIREDLILPDNSHQHDLGIAQSKISDARAAQGDTQGALEHSSTSLDMIRKWAEGDSSDLKRQRDLSAALTRHGNLLLAIGSPESARKQYEEAVQILEKYLSNGDMNVLRDYGAVVFQLGEALASAEKPSEALTEYQKALPIMRQLADLDSSNPDHLRNLALVLHRIGEGILTKETPDTALAKKQLIESFGIFESLLDRQEVPPVWLEDAEAVAISTGDVFAEEKEWQSASDHYLKGLEWGRTLHRLDADEPRLTRNLVAILYKAGRAERQMEETNSKSEGSKYLQEALKLLSGLDQSQEDQEWKKAIRLELKESL